MEIQPPCPLIILWLPCKAFFSHLGSPIEDDWVVWIRCLESPCCKVLREKTISRRISSRYSIKSGSFGVYVQKKWQDHLASCWFETFFHEDNNRFSSCSRVRIEKQFLSYGEIPQVLLYPKFQYHVHNSRPQEPAQFSHVQILIHYVSNIYLNTSIKAAGI